MWAFLQGKKTYIVAIGSVAIAWWNVWANGGDVHVAFQATEVAILGMTVRHGISTSTGAK